jgi:hypothetical protein
MLSRAKAAELSAAATMSRAVGLLSSNDSKTQGPVCEQGVWCSIFLLAAAVSFIVEIMHQQR